MEQTLSSGHLKHVDAAELQTYLKDASFLPGNLFNRVSKNLSVVYSQGGNATDPGLSVHRDVLITIWRSTEPNGQMVRKTEQ